MLTYISNTDHYNLVLSRVASVRKSLWIGTADIKDLYVRVGEGTLPFLAVLAQLVRKGVEVRLIHAKEPGPAFREDFDKYPLVFDGSAVYFGSANLTGAGIGMKGANTRNFEAGILTDESELVRQAMQQFDEVWMGLHCAKCLRRKYCGDPIA